MVLEINRTNATEFWSIRHPRNAVSLQLLNLIDPDRDGQDMLEGEKIKKL
jgi:hypothetical protein